MLFAGFNVHEGEYPLWAAVAVGSVANLVGSWIAYAVGYYGRLELLEKHGKFLHIKPSHLAWADRWFERYGAPAVFFSRMLPIIRTFISLPAGRRADAVLEVQRAHARRLRAVGLHARPSSARRRPRTGRTGRTRCTTSTTRSPCSSSSASSTSPSAGGATAIAGAPRMRRPSGALELRHAVALGALHGPTELLPISSSAHTTLVPWLLGWPYAELDPELRKAFEVALHAGHGRGAAGRAARRGGGGRARPGPPARACSSSARSCRPRSSATRSSARSSGAWARRPTIALGPAARLGGHGGRRPRRPAPAAAARRRARRRAGARRRPGLRAHPRRRRATAMTLGRGARCAASTAPTPTRSRATSRCRSSSAATALKGVRLARRGAAAGASAAPSRRAWAPRFASTLASVRIIRAVERDRSFAPYAAYRAALAALVLRRAWQNRSR